MLFGACTTSLRCRSTATSAVGCTVRRLTSVSMLCVQVAAAANMRELPDSSWKNAQSPVHWTTCYAKRSAGGYDPFLPPLKPPTPHLFSPPTPPVSHKTHPPPLTAY